MEQSDYQSTHLKDSEESSDSKERRSPAHPSCKIPWFFCSVELAAETGVSRKCKSRTSKTSSSLHTSGGLRHGVCSSEQIADLYWNGASVDTNVEILMVKNLPRTPLSDPEHFEAAEASHRLASDSHMAGYRAAAAGLLKATGTFFMDIPRLDVRWLM